MRYNFRIRKDEYIDDYVVDMKCLNCDYEENIPLDILSSFFDPSIYSSLKISMTKLKVISYIK